MVQKIAPLPPIHPTPSGRMVAATGSGAVGGEITPKPATKSNVKTDSKPKFSDTSRFKTRIANTATNLSKATTQARGEGSVTVIFLVAGVCLGLLALGIALVRIGVDKYIVDLIVVGALSIVMGIASFILGMLFTLRPLLRERKRLEEEEQRATATMPYSGQGRTRYTSETVSELMDVPSTSTLHEPSTSASHKHLLTSNAPLPKITSISRKLEPITGNSFEAMPSYNAPQVPEDEDLYDQGSLQASHVSNGKLKATPPPPLAQPLGRERSGTTSTVMSVDISVMRGDNGGDQGPVSHRSLDDDIRAVID